MSMILFLLVFSNYNVSATPQMGLGYIMKSNCTTPTESVTIQAGPGLKYNVSEIKVPKGACVTFTLVNKDTQLHDFAVQNSTNKDVKAFMIEGETTVNGKTVYDGAVNSLNIQMPNVDVKTDFWCTVSGHKDAGMKGTLVVGSVAGSFLPGYEILGALFALLVTSVVVVKRKR